MPGRGGQADEGASDASTRGEQQRPRPPSGTSGGEVPRSWRRTRRPTRGGHPRANTDEGRRQPRTAKRSRAARGRAQRRRRPAGARRDPTTPAGGGRPRADPAMVGVDPAKGRPDPAPNGRRRRGAGRDGDHGLEAGEGERGGGKEEASGAGFGSAAGRRRRPAGRRRRQRPPEAVRRGREAVARCRPRVAAVSRSLFLFF